MPQMMMPLFKGDSSSNKVYCVDLIRRRSWRHQIDSIFTPTFHEHCSHHLILHKEKVRVKLNNNIIIMSKLMDRNKIFLNKRNMQGFFKGKREEVEGREVDPM